MQTMQKITASAVVSELQSSDIYLSVKARLFSLKTNLNGVRVTEAFLDEIVENEDKYIGIQLYADVKGLLANRPIGHMYNPRTGEFKTTPVGSFVKFEKEQLDGDAYLVGTARIMKRNKAVCEAVASLFADNKLKFSFEINCGAYTKQADGTIVIDADPANYFEGQAIVTMPACEEAVALQLVAECLAEGDENAMPNEEKISAEEAVIVAEETVNETVEAEKEIAETEEIENIETAEEVIADSTEETAEVSEEATAEAETDTETAEVYVREQHTTIDEVRAYDPDEHSEVCENVVHTVEVNYVAEDAENNEVAERTDEEKEEETEEDIEAECKEKKCADTEVSELRQMIAELKSELDQVKQELAETKSKKVSASEQTKINPFMAEMTVPKKYSLAEREGTVRERSYRLLERE